MDRILVGVCLALGAAALAAQPATPHTPAPPNAAQETVKDAPQTRSPSNPDAASGQRIQSESGRNQFIAPVMGIYIKGEGVSLPSGVGEPQPEPPSAPTPASER